MATSADKTPAPSTDDTESSNADVSISDQGSTTAVIPGVSINDVLEEPILPTGETLGLLKVLKSVCESGEVKNAETVLSSVLSTEPHFDCSAVDAEGNSPIHYASRKGHANIVQLLLERNFSPAIETHEGDTALHIASQCGHLDVVHTILQHKCNQDLECRNAILAAQNHDGLTALSCAVLNSHPDVAREILGFSTGNPMSSFPDFSNLFPNFISAVEPFALQEPMKLFIVGDRGTGKSTLAKALQSERSAWSKYTFGLVARGRSVREVDTHFTGVITTDFCSQGFGRVIFYDLAGHTNYFHEKLLESPEDLAKSIFIIVVNLRDGVQERLAYWMNFVQHHCSKFQNEASSSSKPHLLIIGSFNDQRKFWTTNWERGVLDSHMLSRRFNLLGKFSLNCRKVNSPEMSKVRSILQKQCQKMHHQFAPSALPSALYALSAVLDQEFGDQSPIPLKLLANKIAEQNTDSEPTLSKLLPPQPEELLSMCQVLQERKRIFLFKNSATDHVEETWLIPNTTVNTLLKRIDTALKGPPENAEADQRLHSNFGLVTSDSLQESLAAQLADLDINLTMQLLEHFRYCERVVPLESSPFAVQSSYFLPGLLPDPNNEMKVPHWEPNERSGFSFAWCLTPIKGQEHLVEYFMPRFLKMLLLSLIRTFLPPSPDVAEATPSTTMVWSRGASWMTRDQVRACIITNDNSINLSMCCQGGSEIACLQLRNQIIATMRAEKEKWQPEIETEEIIIPAISQIVQNPETMKPHFSVSDMHASIKNGTSSITPNDASESSAPVSIESLLFFESCIPLQKLKRFHRAKIIDVARSSEEVSRGFLADLKRCLGEQFDIVAQHFNLPNIGSETSSTSASTPRASQEANIDSARFIPGAAQQADRSLTYGQMWKYLDSLSIFNTTELLQEVQEGDQDWDNVSMRQMSLIMIPDEAPIPPTRSNGPPGVSFFDDRMEIYWCDSKGGVYTKKYHDVYLEIPEGAIPGGQRPISIELGIVREGPFEFPQNVKPVSPVIWFCTNDFEFTDQLKITLPHFIGSKEENQHLAFFKASHVPKPSVGTFSFKPIDSAVPVFGSSQGTLYTTHSCFLCICHSIPERIIASANYCLISAVPKPSHIEDNTFDMHFCVSYFLPTCIETVYQQYKGHKILERRVQLDTEKGSKEPAIRIEFEQDQPHGWVAALTSGNRQILPSEIEFWDPERQHLLMEMKTRERYHGYPPRFTIQACGTTALKTTCMTISFKGFKEEKEIGVVLPLVGRHSFTTLPIEEDSSGFRHMHHRSISSVSGYSLPAMPVPDTPKPTVGRLLNRHIYTLINYLNMDELRVCLRHLGGLTIVEQTRLLDLQLRGPDIPKKWAVEMLVDMLQEKGKHGLKMFTTALEKTEEGTGHHEILEVLKADQDYQDLLKRIPRASQ